MRRRRVSVSLVVVVGALGNAGDAWAQEGGDEGGNPQVIVVPSPAPPTPPPPPDPNSHLPSSSRATSDTSRGDGFDLLREPGASPVVRGGANSSYVTSGEYVPDVHTVKRGDTLWDIAQRYTGNPYNWPRLWSYNKQVQNPHWLYPGDQLHLRGGAGVQQSGAGVGFSRLRGSMTPETVFLRNVGFVQDGEDPAWGTIVGSPEDQMLLSEFDQLYIQLESDREVALGQLLTVFESLDVKSLADEDLVYIRGTVRVNRYNATTHMVRAEIIESLDVIERGAQVGPVDRRIDVVAPRENQNDVQARIIGALWPHQFYGQHQIVFIDKGFEDGIDVGNRFFAVRRGDPWRESLSEGGNMTDDRLFTEDDREAHTEDVAEGVDEDLYPIETYAELMVVRVRRNTATCVVTASKHEMPRGAIIVARKGY